MSLSAMFIFSARNFHSRRIWYEKPAPENGVDLQCRFLERVSMGLRKGEDKERRERRIFVLSLIELYVAMSLNTIL